MFTLAVEFPDIEVLLVIKRQTGWPRTGSDNSITPRDALPLLQRTKGRDMGSPAIVQ